MPQDMSKKEFMENYNSGKGLVRPTSKVDDWIALLETAKIHYTGLTFGVTDFYREIVKGRVSKQRTRTKLEEFEAKGLVLRLWNGRSWSYMFRDE